MHLGEIASGYDFDGAGLSVIFTNLGSGRKTIVDCATYTTDITVVLDAFRPVSGQMYNVELVGRRETGSITRLKFTPYTYSVSAQDVVPASGSYDTVAVQFVRVFEDDNSLHTSSEQWLTI